MLDSGGGGGLSIRDMGRIRVTYFAEEGVFFKTSVCLRFVKEGYFLLPMYEVLGAKIPLQFAKYPRL